ncbi:MULTISPECIES: S1 family peptidase [Nocardia]|uniref:S1 family peptidase n=1 Tax=Nocardia TaxID=1817 RepID=UPI0018935EBD|nr:MULTISPECIES: S1 family peptidase [Nocardia]MBF6350397.1 trypsin-like serine protease [Nocardia flavorosea]
MLMPRIGKRRTAPFRTRTFRAAAAASAAVLLFGPTAVSSAAPDPGPGLPADLIAAISRDLHISPEEYLQRADTAQQVAAFATTAQRQFPQVFAGAWLDEHGKGVVALAPGPGAEEARGAAESTGFVVRNVAKSEQTLRGEKSAFERWLDGQPPAVSALVRGVVIDTVNNSIAVRVDQAGLPMPNFIDPARVIVMAPPVAAETLPAAEIAEGSAAAPLGGGDGYASVAGDGSLRCSFGFNGIGPAGNTVNITAGHCNPDLDNVGAASVHESLGGNRVGPKIATFQKSVLGNQDYSILAIEDGAAGRFENNQVKVPGAAPVPVEGVATPVVGAPVCKSGSRTGFSCGVVNAVDQTVQVGDRQLTQSFSANICALPGDSGGAIVTGRLALGISSASSVADYPICEIPNILGVLTGNAPQLFAQPVSVVLSDNPGLRIRTS